MGKLWLKIMKDHKLVRDIVLDCQVASEGQVELDAVRPEMSAACNELDVEFPVVVEANRKEFARRNRTDFRADSFIQPVDFDKLEVIYYDPEK